MLLRWSLDYGRVLETSEGDQLIYDRMDSKSLPPCRSSTQFSMTLHVWSAIQTSGQLSRTSKVSLISCGLYQRGQRMRTLKNYASHQQIREILTCRCEEINCVVSGCTQCDFRICSHKHCSAPAVGAN